jgi:hypothetical protein
MRAVLRWSYFVLAWAVVADLCLQFYYAAYGAFAAFGSGASAGAGFGGHSANANVVFVLMLAALVVAIIAAATRGGVGWARVIGHVVLPVLVVVQIVLFIIGEAFGATEQNPLPALLGLHGLNGVAMLILALWLGVGAFRFLRAGSSARETELPA